MLLVWPFCGAVADGELCSDEAPLNAESEQNFQLHGFGSAEFLGTIFGGHGPVSVVLASCCFVAAGKFLSRPQRWFRLGFSDTQRLRLRSEDQRSEVVNENSAGRP